METLVEIKSLSVGFFSQKNYSNVVNSISFNIPKGKTVALVGESGSGKTVTALSILKLLPYPAAFHDSGEIIFHGQDINGLDDTAMIDVRKRIQVIFQDPFSSLNPRMKIGEIITEPMKVHNIISDEILIAVALADSGRPLARTK